MFCVIVRKKAGTGRGRRTRDENRTGVTDCRGQFVNWPRNDKPVSFIVSITRISATIPVIARSEATWQSVPPSFVPRLPSFVLCSFVLCSLVPRPSSPAGPFTPAVPRKAAIQGMPIRTPPGGGFAPLRVVLVFCCHAQIVSTAYRGMFSSAVTSVSPSACA